MTRRLALIPSVLCCAALVSCTALAGGGIFYAAPPGEGVPASALEANGVYRSPECWFAGTTLELWNGRYRSWSYSDVMVDGVNQRGPEVGSYSVDGDRLSMTRADGAVSTSYFDAVQGHKLLWSERQRALYREEGRVSWALIYVGEPPVGGKYPHGTLGSSGPSIEILYDDEMRARDQREYEERYSGFPEPARTLLRARSIENDPNLDTYKSAVAAARAQQGADLPRQLLELMHVPPERTDQGIECESILSDLYTRSWLIESRPAFLDTPEERARAVGALIDAMAVIRDHNVLSDALKIFLRSIDRQQMNLQVPEVGASLTATVGSGRSGSFGSDLAGGSSREDWAKAMPVIVPAVQKWCRQALKESSEKSR